MNFIIRLLVSALAVIVTSYLLPGVYIDGFLTAIIVALVLAFLNAILKPILVILTIPITIFTFGFFLLVINAVIILLASEFVGGFYVDGFWWALLFSIILTIVSSLFGVGKRREN
ncbi:MAG: phage holin family protein [Bacteroidales bacterium]|nr:phage holin family protein [Bacteroidales bacterium]